MEFDKSRVYTAVNADELKIGSKCIFADTIQDLRQKVQGEDAETYVETLTNLYDDDSIERFAAGCYTHIYAYLIEPPKEPRYKPFESVEKAMEAIKKHGGWVKHRVTNSQILTIGFNFDGVFLGNSYHYSFIELFQEFTFADDDSPCGELAEE